MQQRMEKSMEVRIIKWNQKNIQMMISIEKNLKKNKKIMKKEQEKKITQMKILTRIFRNINY